MSDKIYRIGVISDTHGLLRDEIKKVLSTCDVILHGGDINRQEILDKLNTFAVVYAVRGNNDKEWAEYLPETLDLEVYGLRIFMIHNKKQIPEDLGAYDLVIYGHSHKYEEKEDGERIWLNPGSCGPRRFRQPITMAVIEAVEWGKIGRVKKIEIEHSNSVKSADTKGGFFDGRKQFACLK